jgi:uncharacterized protein YegP (UPF0339 family)
MAMTTYRQVVLGVLVAVVAGLLSYAAAPAQDKKAGKDKTAVVFELYKDKGGEFRFRIKDDDGHILAITQKSYEKKEDILKVIDTIKKGASTAKVDDQSGKK